MNLPTIQAALIKVIGVISFKPFDISKFTALGYQTIKLTEQDVPPNCSDPKNWIEDQINNTKQFYKDTYYPEFASLMFTGDSDYSKLSALKLSKTFELSWTVKQEVDNVLKEITVKAKGICQELFLFDQYQTGIFALTFEPESLDFFRISNMIHGLRSFDNSMNYNGSSMKFHEFISLELLGGHALRGGNALADSFSGSKFKIYSIISTDEPDDGACYSRDFLAYEIGTGSRIGEMGSNGYNSPSQVYFDEIFKNSIKVFRNYTGLALLDSFTVVGQNVYKSAKDNYFQHYNYNRVYFGIYIFNLFLRYNLFRYNVIFQDNPVRIRDEFQNFINKFNFSHISFKFLPNIFNKKIHDALEIDVEVAHFEKRLVGLATRIQEDQQKRQATLLGIVSFITGLSSFKDILDLLESGRSALGWPSVAFYFTLTLVFFLLAIPALTYLFPDLTKKAIRKFKKRRVVKNGHEV
jgi:hypothetical protein